MKMASVSYQISNLLEKMASNDKDFRFMATNDLMSELQKDSIKLDDDSEKKVVRMVLRLLEDKNGEVQNLAVKCLGPLVNKVKECQVETIVDSLCANMVSNKEQLRDISSIGLKTVISELPHSTGTSGLAANVCQRITGKLSAAIEKQEDVSVQLEALDILSDLLSRFGELLVPFHTSILRALIPQLDSPRQAVRKRAIVALSHSLTSCSPALYNKVVEHLLTGLEQHTSPANVRTYIQCLASICRQAGHRLCGHMERAMELLVQYSREEDDELREYCLQACEAFVNKCPEPIHPHIPTITNLCLSYISYDPNYNYEAEDSTVCNTNDYTDSSAMDTEDENDEGDSEEYSDDDDMSWKVRRSAAKCLEAVITNRPELMEEFYKTVSPILISRFKEREENVKSDIFHAYIALLRATKPSEDNNLENESMEQQDSLLSQLQEQVPKLVKAVQPLMREKSVKTRQDCFLLLRELLFVLPGALVDHVNVLMPGIHYSLGCEKTTTSNIKIDALSFLDVLLSSHSPKVFYDHIKDLCALIVIAVSDPFYKIATEALLVLQRIVKVIRPIDDLETPFQFACLVPSLYRSTLQRLKTPEVDQEVKERAIACMGQLVANLGDFLKPELDTCLPIFLERLRNEVTRLSTVKALTVIACSPLQVNMCPILPDVIPTLGSFLRKNQRALKLNSLILLNTIVQNYCHCFESNLLLSAIGEMQPLLNESDLHVTTMTLTVLTSTAQKVPSALIHVNDYIIPEVLQLVRSPLLQGSALNSTLLFFQAIVAASLPKLGYRDLLSLLVAPVLQTGKVQLHKQAFHSMARCVAALTLQCPDEAIPVARELLQDIQRPRSDSHLVFCLLTIGEIGRHFDLSTIEPLPTVLLETFSTPSEEVKGAASHALGAVCVGNLEYYLPFILQEIEAQPKKQYLLLHSLKEVITSLSVNPEKLSRLLPSVPSIWLQLFRHCECSEEGSRNVVAECLGKLVLVDPQNLLQELRQALNSPSALMRTTVVTAVKFTISDQPQAVDPLLKQCIGQFLSALEDPEVSVRRVALVAFNSAVHNKPSLVRDLLVSLLPQLYEETKVKKELIREVEMGPFKHTVDDGLDIRKAAFECMYTLLEQGLEKVDVFQFLDHVQGGLKDHYDIKMLTYLMTARLAQLCPNAVLQRLEQLVEPLRATCTLKVKANSVKQEYEKQDELKRSALRAVVALLAIPKADKNPHLSDFLSLIRGSSDLLPLYESVQKDSTLNCEQNNQMDQRRKDIVIVTIKGRTCD